LAQQKAFDVLDAERADLIQTLISAAHEPPMRALALEVGLAVDAAVRWRGYWDAWYAVLLNLLLAAQVVGDRTAQAKLWERIGALYSLRSEQERAAAAHRTSLRIVPELGGEGDAVAAWAMAGLIDDARRRGTPQEALEHVSIALNVARNAGVPSAANVYLVSANVYGELEDWARALEYAQLAYVHWRHINDEIGAAKALHTLGIIYRAMRRFDLAMQVTAQAAETYRSVGSSYLLGLADVLRGNLYQDLGDWAGAEPHYRAAVAQLVVHRSTFDLAVAQENLGIALVEQGRLDEAEPYLLGALDAWRDLHIDGQMVRVLYTLGSVYEQSGRRDEAVRSFTEALGLAGTVEHGLGEERLIDDIRACLQRLDSDKGD
jgi:tetratricopeptide (TPR) repeat protein